MITVNKISEIKSAGSYLYNGAVINVTDVLESGRIICTVTLADGTTFAARNRPSSLKYRIEHGGEQREKTTKVVIPCGHADNSTCHGEHKTVISANCIGKKHRSVMKALAVLNGFLGYQDSLSMQVNVAWYEFTTEQDRLAAEAEQRRLKRDAERKEAEAKKAADEAAKKQKEEQKLRRAMIESYAKKKGLPLDKAEANLIALGII